METPGGMAKGVSEVMRPTMAPRWVAVALREVMCRVVGKGESRVRVQVEVRRCIYPGRGGFREGFS